MRVSFENDGLDHYQYWALHDRKIFKKICELIKDTKRSPFEGIGKPEPLKENLAGYWSRRITDEHRLVYKVKDEEIIIAQCRYHY